MLANITCPACQYRYALDEGQMGSRQICPKCRHAFVAGKSTFEVLAGAAPAAAAQSGYGKTMLTEAAPPIKYKCPRCQTPLEAEAIEAGTKKPCPKCTQRHQVPAAPRPQPAAPEPALNKTMLAGDTGAPPAPPIKYNCPKCKKPLEAPADQAGTKRHCPACNQRLQIPAAPPAASNANRTMLAAADGAAPASSAPGAPVAASGGGPVPVAAPAPANPWAQLATPKNVVIGVLLLLLLLYVGPAVLRGGKYVDNEAQAKYQFEIEKLKAEIETKRAEMEQRSKAEAEIRRQIDEMERTRRAQEERLREEFRRAMRDAEDDGRRAALKRRQQQEQEQRDRESRERDAKLQQQLTELKQQKDKAERDLESRQRQQQTIIQQPPPVVYYPPYHPGYYRPWWW